MRGGEIIFLDHNFGQLARIYAGPRRILPGSGYGVRNARARDVTSARFDRDTTQHHHRRHHHRRYVRTDVAALRRENLNYAKYRGPNDGHGTSTLHVLHRQLILL